MQIHLLGTAAGGGVPQWNCACPICVRARANEGRVRPRSQSSVALSADGKRWFLLNASPDIRAQIEGFRRLRPSHRTVRNSPIEGVLLTNADLDHTLGLSLLREGKKLRVHATSAVRVALSKGFTLAPVLDSFCGIEWIEPPTDAKPLLYPDGSSSGLKYQAIPLIGKAPRFIKRTRASQAGYSVGYCISDEKTGGRLLFLPEVAEIDDALMGFLPECDVLLFDGTFWWQNEMRKRGTGTLSAADMGHIPIGGGAGSLRVLKRLRIRHKIYIHVNNTNPTLIEDSAEHAAIKAAGCTVGYDGMQVTI